MRWVFRVLVLMSAVAVLAVIHPPAWAEDLDALLHRGVELRRQGREQEAFAVFKRAAQIKKTPRVMTQLAFVEQALGQ